MYVTTREEPYSSASPEKCQGTGKVNPADSRTSDSWGTMQFLSRSWTLYQLYALFRVLEGLWEFTQPIQMCFWDVEKAFESVPCSIMWGCSWSMRSKALCQGLCCLYMMRAGAWSICHWSIASNKSDLVLVSAWLPFITRSVHYFYGTA